MSVAVFANRAAGRGASVRAAGELAAALAAHGIEASVVQPGAEHVERVVGEYVASGTSTIIACGGDGTVHRVCQRLVGTQTALGILPRGTGNDIAAALGMTGVTIQGLASSIAAGRVRAVDVARAQYEAGERWFLGVLSTGFDSTVNERANRMRLPLGPGRYLAGVALEIGRFRAKHYDVDIDSVRFTRPGMLVCIANGGTYGGGMRVCPAAQVDDGLLDVTWVDEIPTLEFLKVLPRVFGGSHVNHPKVHTYRATRVTVQASGQTAYADGERLGPLPVSAVLVPGALRVVDTGPSRTA